MPEPATLASLIGPVSDSARKVSTLQFTLPLRAAVNGSPFDVEPDAIAGRSVVVRVRDMAKAVAALISLDGVARRILLCPPGWTDEKALPAAQLAGADVIACDEAEASTAFALRLPVTLPVRPIDATPRSRETEWILPTSGTLGPPKLAVHSLQSLLGAISGAKGQQWATFYDIRRFGGLQILLRAFAGDGSLQLSGENEPIEGFLSRCGASGVTHISGTPTHWRMALLSGAAGSIRPEYLRLSGEIADASLLARLAAAYPRAIIEHAYASTEAGLVFEVGDRQAGFPAAWLGDRGPIRLRLRDGSLRVHTPYRALRLLSGDASALVDEEGFVDTGDMIEIRGDRCFFAGRRGGIINVGGLKVHPEEVEAALNGLGPVRACRVFAKFNPIMGSIIVAEILPEESLLPTKELEQQILSLARERLPPYMAPAQLRFVTQLTVSDAGKLRR